MGRYTEQFEQFVKDSVKQMSVEALAEVTRKPEHKFQAGDEAMYGGEPVIIDGVLETPIGNCYAFMFDDEICFAYWWWLTK